MALADPLSITYDGTAVSLPRTGMGNNEGVFTSADGAFTLNVKHSYGSTNTHSVLLRRKALVASSTVPANNINVAPTVSLTIRTPNQGVTVAELQKQLKALADFLSASTYAIGNKIVAGES
jgi:hypothetical protein